MLASGNNGPPQRLRHYRSLVFLSKVVPGACTCFCYWGGRMPNHQMSQRGQLLGEHNSCELIPAPVLECLKG